MTDANLATELMAERMVIRVLLILAGNLATQLSLMDGGDPTTVRAVINRAVETMANVPRDPAAFGFVDQVIPKPDPSQAFSLARPMLVEAVTQVLGAAVIKSPNPRRPN